MVIVQLTGGLGNQLFQYATARGIAFRNNADLKLDLSWFENHAERSYAVDAFRVPGLVATREEIERLCPSRWSLAWAVRQIKERTRPYARRRVIRERRKRFDPRVLEVKGEAYLIGCWQCERYFEDVAGLIRRDLKPEIAFADADASMLRKMQTADSISVHLRRGDYVRDPVLVKLYGTPGLDYYAHALDLIARRVTNPHAFVFSDDIPWARANLKTGIPTEFIDHVGPQQDVRDLILMSRCRHHVIANSSFSWWGAWLAEHPGQIVVAPDPWFRNPKWAPADIVPERWLRVRG